MAVLIICAAVFTVALAAVCIAGKQQVLRVWNLANDMLATQYGLGRHIWLLPMLTLFDTLKDCILVGAKLSLGVVLWLWRLS